MVVDNRDATFQDRRVTPLPGPRKIDEAYEVAERVLAELPLLAEVAAQVKAAHAIVREVTGSAVTDPVSGEPSVQFSIELKDRGRCSSYEGAPRAH